MAAARVIPAVPTAENLWAGWYAWHPMIPIDDHGPFWLEDVWHRRHLQTGRRELRELISRAL